MAQSTTKSSFMRLPPELRIQVYAHVFDDKEQQLLDHPLLAVSKTLHSECIPILAKHMLLLICSWSERDRAVRILRKDGPLTELRWPSNCTCLWPKLPHQKPWLYARWSVLRNSSLAGMVAHIKVVKLVPLWSPYIGFDIGVTTKVQIRVTMEGIRYLLHSTEFSAAVTRLMEPKLERWRAQEMPVQLSVDWIEAFIKDVQELLPQASRLLD